MCHFHLTIPALFSNCCGERWPYTLILQKRWYACSMLSIELNC